MTRKKTRKWLVVILIAAFSLWAYEHRTNGVDPSPEPKSAPPQNQAHPAKKSRKPSHRQSGKTYEIYRNCTFVTHRSNDGDSFRVRLPDGRTEIFRLYFVDAPESAFRRYRNGETNHARIRDQAADLGNITPAQAVEIGKKAKHFTAGLLTAAPFTLHTRWDSPFHDRRYHAFIEIPSRQKPRWLHELLVERGFCRIHTKGADLPGGPTAREQKAQLRTWETTAKQKAAGAWGF